MFSVRVPPVAGTLELWSADGALLGEVVLNPEAPVTRQAALMRDSDIVGGFTKVVDHGPRSDKVDILFLAEGYTQSELSRFRQHVTTITNGVSRRAGYREYWDRFNVWRLDVKSRSRGTGANGSPNDTAFETASGISGVDRCVFFANSRGQRAAESLGDQLGADVVIVLANRTTTGACASFSTMYFRP